MYSFSSKKFIPTVITLAIFSFVGVLAIIVAIIMAIRWSVLKCMQCCRHHCLHNNNNDNVPINDVNVAAEDEEGGEGGNGGERNLNCCFP